MKPQHLLFFTLTLLLGGLGYAIYEPIHFRLMGWYVWMVIAAAAVALSIHNLRQSKR